jgi:hypothetical protein
MEASLQAPRLVDAPAPAGEVEAAAEAVVAAYGAEPWTRRDLVQFSVLSAVSLALLAAGWIGAGGEALFEDQTPFLNLAVAGLLVGAAGGALWLVTGLRAVRVRKARVKELITARAGGGAVAGAETASDRLVSGPSMTRYHLAGCSLVAGKDVTAASQAEHERAGRRPCGMCRR